ncbi:TetR/AcrR family transcriptional regulator [Nocardia spumae]|uniref:TetR/AcrR family transcriptional regulator n=1 Tax=Nocardia spumae TaxID=2887190 RepID=UPI001D159B56|nr:TetR family transcriptional regulator [Nocardia spumae]
MTGKAPDAPATSDSRSLRRDAIREAALDLAASGGNRAITHHAIDDRLGIARGSTSYYYRTRQHLLEAAIEHLAATSRAAFDTARAVPDTRDDPLDGAAELITGQLDLLLGDRRRDSLARYALAADTAGNEELRRALAVCLFSLPAAEALLTSLGAPDPEQAARDLISLLEGLLFDRLHGLRSLLEITPDTAASRDDLRPTIRRWLRALSR